jgi:hypothetical protein
VKPIIFSTDMVKAILEGRKTQTRRVIKPQPKFVPSSECGSGKDQWEYHPVYWYAEDGPGRLMNRCCPYGQVGDKLWVRETFHATDIGHKVHYKVNDNNPTWMKWTPSIHMPRWASRITLEITEIRLERLQEITEEDAEAEGIRVIDNTLEKIYSPPNYPDIHRDIFIGLWDSINGKKHPWSSNPWVWVISFKMLKDKDEGR